MPQNLKALTALRFFAAMWVVIFDFWPALGRPMPAFIAKGYLGVELFFVLSGFILSHVYLGAVGERRFSYPGFLWARLARVYPVHLATLALMGAMVGAAILVGLPAGDKVLVWSSLPAQLTLTQAWGLAPLGGWNHPSWSISAEWFAYLAFPGFAWLAWRLRARPRLAVGLAVLLVAALESAFARLAGFPLTQATIAWGALRIVPCFSLGCAVFLLWASHPVRTSRTALVVCAMAMAAIVGAAQVAAPDWISVALFGALLFGLASVSGAGSTFLTSPVWTYLGEISFSIYMVCIPWQLASGKLLDHLLAGGGPAPLWLWLMQVLGVVPLAIVIHHLVERPARDTMRRHGVPFGLGRASPAPPFAPALGSR